VGGVSPALQGRDDVNRRADDANCTMTDIRSKLLRLGYKPNSSSDGEASEHHAPEAASNLSGNRFAFLLSRRSPHTVERVLPGEHVSTPFGDCFVVEHQYPPGHPHGIYRLDEALEVDPQAFSLMSRDLAGGGFDLAESVCIDLETTGLAGGTGTYAFMVGIGHFQGLRFVVRQFFMKDYDVEEALLHALAEALEPFRGGVTFNGKVFDVPLLETRFQMARRPFPLRGLPHLDLLFPARRLWKARLESCALSYLEREILGVEREADVPGWAIPGIYFDYLRTGDARPLVPVFEHNRQDLLSLVTLAIRLARQYADPLHPDVRDCRDLCALAATCEGLGMHERAALCYERAVDVAPLAEMRGRAMLRLGSLYKRMQLREEAVELWKKLAEGGHSYTLAAYVEMAKHFEHVARDYYEAERLARRALAILELRAAAGNSWLVEQQREELEHRLARLRRKLGLL